MRLNFISEYFYLFFLLIIHFILDFVCEILSDMRLFLYLILYFVWNDVFRSSFYVMFYFILDNILFEFIFYGLHSYTVMRGDTLLSYERCVIIFLLLVFLSALQRLFVMISCDDWWASAMIGGLFIYNHKGEVLISRVYRDDIGWVPPMFPWAGRESRPQSVNAPRRNQKIFTSIKSNLRIWAFFILKNGSKWLIDYSNGFFNWVVD